MPSFSLSRISLTLPAVLMAQTAMADVTAAQVWGDWKQYMQSMGYTMQATETANGDSLQISDLSMSMILPENAGEMRMSMGSLAFEQDGDAVNVVMPQTMPISVEFTPEGSGSPVRIVVDYTQSGHNLRVSGSPTEMVYDYAAAGFGAVLTELTAEGETFSQDDMKFVLNGTDATSQTKMRLGNMRTYEQSWSVGQMTYDVNIADPRESTKVKLNGGIQGLSVEGGGAIPIGTVDFNDMSAMLRAGFAANGTLRYSGGNMVMDVADEADGDFAGTTSSTGGTIAFNMDQGGLLYDVAQTGAKVTAKVPDLPFPVEFSMAESGFKLAMPISVSEDPQDFAFGLTFGDFEMSDLIWSIFDGSGQLPRDPATIKLDLSGKAQMLVDIMNPEAAASGDVPGELRALTLNTLLVDAVGAMVRGSGDFAFDNSDTTTYDGMPKPVGAINIDIAGANGLMDKLVAMGLLPEEQAMGARMMMGLFAVPGDAPDTLKSTVEFNEAGQILANGQRIK